MNRLLFGDNLKWLRDTKLYEVARDGTEHPYMRQGKYGRWLSCR